MQNYYFEKIKQNLKQFQDSESNYLQNYKPYSNTKQNLLGCFAFYQYNKFAANQPQAHHAIMQAKVLLDSFKTTITQRKEQFLADNPQYQTYYNNLKVNIQSHYQNAYDRAQEQLAPVINNCKQGIELKLQRFQEQSNKEITTHLHSNPGHLVNVLVPRITYAFLQNRCAARLAYPIMSYGFNYIYSQFYFNPLHIGKVKERKNNKGQRFSRSIRQLRQNVWTITKGQQNQWSKTYFAQLDKKSDCINEERAETEHQEKIQVKFISVDRDIKQVLASSNNPESCERQMFETTQGIAHMFNEKVNRKARKIEQQDMLRDQLKLTNEMNNSHILGAAGSKSSAAKTASRNFAERALRSLCRFTILRR